MAKDSKAFLTEMQGLVAKKHSKDHPLFAMIENGELTQAQLRGFVKQFYLLFPKPFPKPIAAMFSRCPEDPEPERRWMETLTEGETAASAASARPGLRVTMAVAGGERCRTHPRGREGDVPPAGPGRDSPRSGNPGAPPLPAIVVVQGVAARAP